MNKVLEKIKKGSIFFFKHHLYLMVLLFAIDMISKFLMEAILIKHGTIVVIPNFFSFELVYNPGSFSGFLGGLPFGTHILMFISLIGGIVSIVFFVKKFFTMTLPIRIALYLLIPGCFGNMIDRFLKVIGVKEGVIDFLSFNLPIIGQFPVFNFADICLTLAMFIILFTLIYEEFIKKDDKKIEIANTENTSNEEINKESQNNDENE